jgi:hypothetical protein
MANCRPIHGCHADDNDGRTDGRTMAIELPVTWTRTVASVIKLPGGKTLASARTHSFPSSPSSPSRELPSPSPTDAVCCPDADVPKKQIFYFLLFFFLVVVAGLKREKKISVFNPRDPRAKPREEEGFFGLVPLVTHPSSIPLLGCLTPKFL